MERFFCYGKHGFCEKADNEECGNCKHINGMGGEYQEYPGADNPYWERISAISERQRAKGIKVYGQGLENNPADILTRLTYLEEELIDGLMYIEWIKDKIKEREANDKDDTAAENP